MKTISLVLLMLITAQAHGSSHTRSTNFTLGGEVIEKNLVIVASTTPGFHFNPRAPHFLTRLSPPESIRPLKVELHTITFKIPEPKTESFQASLFLCDDAQSHCSKQTAPFSWNQPIE